MLTCAQSIRMSESLSRRRIWPLMCYAIKWSFTAAYLFLLVMGTVGFLRDFSGWLLITLGLPWTLFLDSFGKIDGLSGVSPVVLKISRASDQSGDLFLNLLVLTQTSNALQRLMRWRRISVSRTTGVWTCLSPRSLKARQLPRRVLRTQSRRESPGPTRRSRRSRSP